MARKQKLTDEQVALKKRVVKAYTKSGGFRYHHPSWNKNLWSKPTSEVTEFLERKFETTFDVVEYYTCMVYLYNAVPDSELLVEFGDVERVVNMRETYNHLNQNKALNRIQQKAIEHDANVCAMSESINVVGFSGGT